MATSGTVIFSVNRSELINAALRTAGVIDPEVGTANASQLSFGGQALNLMLKSWEAYGLQLWQRRWAAIFPQLNQMVYILGSPGPAGDHACISTPLGTGFVSTNLSTAALSGATSITVDSISTTGTAGVPSISILTTWNIGIKLTNGTRFWTTVNGAPSGTTITLTNGLTFAADDNASVICYKTKLMRPLRVLDGFTRQVGGNDVPHLLLSREQYNRFGMKSSSGTTIQTYYDPQALAGNFYVYPATLDVTQIIYIEFTKPIEDITGATDDFDMPQEWGETTKWGLALRMGFEYGTPKDKLSAIKTMADQTFALVDGYDQEPTSVLITPDAWAYAPQYSGSNK